MKIEIPDKIVEQLAVIDSINSARATANEKDPEKFRAAFRYCHMLTQHVADEVVTLLLNELIKERKHL